MAQIERPHPFTLPSLDLFSFMSAPFPRTQVDRDLNAMADLISDSSAFKPLNDVSQMFGLRGTSLAHAIPSGKIICFLERTGLSDNLGVVEWISNITTRFFNQNRADHSLKVFDVAREWGKRLGLSDEKLKVACAVAICHDIGHRAWAHTG